MSYINSTTPNRYTLSQHITIAENVKYWLKTARQREITLAAGLTLCILWWGGQVWGGGRGTVWGDDHDRQVIPVSSLLPKPLFCLHTTQQREITPAAGLTLYTVVRRTDSHLYWDGTSTVTLYITSIWVIIIIYHQKLYHFVKTFWKNLAPVRSCDPLSSGRKVRRPCNLNWAVTSRGTWYITSISVNVDHDHKKLCRFEKKNGKNSQGVRSCDTLSCGRCNYTVSVTWTGVLHPDLHGR